MTDRQQELHKIIKYQSKLADGRYGAQSEVYKAKINEHAQNLVNMGVDRTLVTNAVQKGGKFSIKLVEKLASPKAQSGGAVTKLRESAENIMKKIQEIQVGDISGTAENIDERLIGLNNKLYDDYNAVSKMHENIGNTVDGVRADTSEKYGDLVKIVDTRIGEIGKDGLDALHTLTPEKNDEQNRVVRELHEHIRQHNPPH